MIKLFLAGRQMLLIKWLGELVKPVLIFRNYMCNTSMLICFPVLFNLLGKTVCKNKFI